MPCRPCPQSQRINTGQWIGFNDTTVPLLIVTESWISMGHVPMQTWSSTPPKWQAALSVLLGLPQSPWVEYLTPWQSPVIIVGQMADIMFVLPCVWSHIFADFWILSIINSKWQLKKCLFCIKNLFGKEKRENRIESLVVFSPSYLWKSHMESWVWVPICTEESPFSSLVSLTLTPHEHQNVNHLVTPSVAQFSFSVSWFPAGYQLYKSQIQGV